MPRFHVLRRRVVSLTPAALACLACTAPAWAQGAWTIVPKVPQEIEALPTFVRAPLGGAVARIDWRQLQQELDDAPLEGTNQPPSLITLPTPDGALALYHIVESPIMEAGLGAQFHEFRTYKVWGVDQPGASGRLDVTTQGLRGMIRVPQSADAPNRFTTIFLDPYSARQREYMSIYTTRDLGTRELSFICHTGPEHGAGQPFDPSTVDGPSPDLSPAGSVVLRQYRLAMACTGEFGAFHSQLQGRPPNQTDAFAAIVTVANRSNVVFEDDLGVRFVLAANSNTIAYFNPATDPYPDPDPACTVDPAANCSGPYLNANVTALNNAIGNANFDVGHVLTRVRGGVASLRSVCSTGNKARGISGIPRGGELDPLSAFVPLHELGHQFGANHTFNGTQGRCQGNINSTTSWEPGGGSTIMAYPGACPVGGPYGDGITDNLVQYGDEYFHPGSLLEMRSFLATASSNCSTNISTTNIGPVIASITPSGLSVPPSTPFALTVVASDPDGEALLYQWDQIDPSQPRPLAGPGSGDFGDNPLFRSFPPTNSPTRTFPRMRDILRGTPSLGERMPTFAPATRDFRVVIRDNRGGINISSNIALNVVAGTPFTVTGPAAGTALTPGGTALITWNAGATNGAPFNVSTVEVSLSTQGGLDDFPIVLATSAANTGSVVAPIPAGLFGSADARIRVRANNHVFFNVSGALRIPGCDSPDFNRDGDFPTPLDLEDFINANAGSFCPACSTDLDFNNDGDFPTPLDVEAFIRVLSGGTCL